MPCFRVEIGGGSGETPPEGRGDFSSRLLKGGGSTALSPGGFGEMRVRLGGIGALPGFGKARGGSFGRLAGTGVGRWPRTGLRRGRSFGESSGGNSGGGPVRILGRRPLLSMLATLDR